MRIELKFYVKKISAIPIGYNHILQSAIYNSLTYEFGKKVHNSGFEIGKRSYKLFTFSRLFFSKAKFDKKLKTITFDNTVSFWLSSIDEEFIDSFTKIMTKRKYIVLGDNVLYLDKISVPIGFELKNNVFIKFISPITIHSTITDFNNKKRTYFYSPSKDRQDFQEHIYNNINRKYIAYYGKYAQQKLLLIEPVKYNNKSDKVVIRYQNFSIDGHFGIYRLSGDIDIMGFSYDVGLGARNSCGFGMWEIVNYKE